MGCARASLSRVRDSKSVGLKVPSFEFSIVVDGSVIVSVYLPKTSFIFIFFSDAKQTLSDETFISII